MHYLSRPPRPYASCRAHLGTTLPAAQPYLPRAPRAPQEPPGHQEGAAPRAASPATSRTAGLSDPPAREAARPAPSGDPPPGATTAVRASRSPSPAREAAAPRGRSPTARVHHAGDPRPRRDASPSPTSARPGAAPKEPWRTRACHFHGTPKGCLKGDKCDFRHDQGPSARLVGQALAGTAPPPKGLRATGRSPPPAAAGGEHDGRPAAPARGVSWQDGQSRGPARAPRSPSPAIDGQGLQRRRPSE